MTRRPLAFTAASTAVALAATTLSAPASATELPSEPIAPGSEALPDGQDTIIVEDLDAEGRVLDRRTLTEADPLSGYDDTASSESTKLLRASGDGGDSTSTGCRRVTVKNEAETLLGATAYWYNTWTEWCWNRSTKTISNVVTGQYLRDVDPAFAYREIVFQDERFYQWQSGFNKSGHWHERQVHIENCVWACFGSTYPRNILRAHSDGTWTWRTDG